MPSIISIGGKADNDGFPLIGDTDDLIEGPGIAPGGLKAELRRGSLNTRGIYQAQLGSDCADLGFDRQYIGNAEITTIGVEDLGH